MSDVAHQAAQERQRLLLGLGGVVGDAGDGAVHLRAAERLAVHLLADGRAHDGWAAQMDAARAADHDDLVGQRGDVGAARGRGAEDDGDLRDARGRHAALPPEGAAEVVPVGEHAVLLGQERPAAVHEVEARQAVRLRDLLRAGVLGDRLGEEGAALHRGVVGQEHHRRAGDEPDPRDDARARDLAAVEAGRGERRELEERRARIEEEGDPVANGHLAALDVAGAVPLSPAPRRRGDRTPQLQRGLGRLSRGCAAGVVHGTSLTRPTPSA